jgi:hypothetical protein
MVNRLHAPAGQAESHFVAQIRADWLCSHSQKLLCQSEVAAGNADTIAVGEERSYQVLAKKPRATRDKNIQCFPL